MPPPVKLTKSDAQRAMVRHHFAPCSTQMDAFHRLRSIQFDPIAPVGCNHDLVLQSRVSGYRIGDWQQLAYKERLIYDGWDKMASLVPFEGWPVRRIIYDLYRQMFDKKIFQDHKHAVEAVLKEIQDKGPLMPRDFEFQQRKEEWKEHWYGPSVTKQTLRALWHSGLIMTADRKNGQHLYDLTERIVPTELQARPRVSDEEARLELVLDRHRATGILRPGAASEVWSNQLLGYSKKTCISELVAINQLLAIDVEGMAAHATPEFLNLLDEPALEPQVRFIAPLDQFMWDRKMIRQVFGFDYIWEIYVPEAKRKWGYYVLPVLFGNDLVARAEFWCRDGVLELRQWLFEEDQPPASFWPVLEAAVKQFMHYCSAKRTSVKEHIEARVRDSFLAISL